MRLVAHSPAARRLPVFKARYLVAAKSWHQPGQLDAISECMSGPPYSDAERAALDYALSDQRGSQRR